MNHTPTPWVTGGTFFHGMDVKSTSLYGKPKEGMQSGRLIARGINIPDAEFIVTACNEYDSLKKRVEDLETALQIVTNERDGKREFNKQLKQRNQRLTSALRELYKQEYPADMQFFEVDFERFLNKSLEEVKP